MSAATGFLERWSRRKREAAAGLPPGDGQSVVESLPLPDPATVTFDDDFSGFLRQEVQEQVKRLALKKLFHSPQFNVMDGLDVYIDDYTIPDPIEPAFLRSLNQARGLVFDEPEEAAAEAQSPVAEVTPVAASTAEQAPGDLSGGAHAQGATDGQA